ncbi:MAG TPA: glycosyltransferase [Chitinophagaceae bacterium]|nr:glycosyltransferase [Chitinophagaceae bacterium]HNM35079.1 glycosyltransferase [Chitinophagaceae bacterium]
MVIKSPKIILTVTNDISYDQRMQRICNSLSKQNYSVLLVGRSLSSSKLLPNFNFKTKRLNCFFKKGFLFYVEYNLRLFFFLLFIKADILCAIDLDTIIPNYLISVLKRKKRVYDAHELFTEQKEIITRPLVHKFWLSIEQFFVPKFKKGYTVNIFIQQELNRRYNVNYSIIRNLPVKIQFNTTIQNTNSNFIIYQGAVNEGRSFETLIPAMLQVNCNLLICGKGNFFEQTKQLIYQHKLQHKIELRGYVNPEELKTITPTALIGLTLFEKTGLNQYYSLSNRFFDYIMAGIPQVCVGYPEYKAINDKYEIALLINVTDESTIADAINELLNNKELHKQLQNNCIKARELLNWENEEKDLLQFWKNIVQ